MEAIKGKNKNMIPDKRIFLIPLLFLCFDVHGSDYASLQAFGKNVVSAFHSKSFTAFQEFLPKEKDVELLFRHQSPDSKPVKEGAFKTGADNIEAVGKAGFKQLIESEKEAEIEWAKVQLKDLNFDLVKDKGLLIGKVELRVDFSGTSGLITLTDCFWSGTRWLIGGGMAVTRGVEDFTWCHCFRVSELENVSDEVNVMCNNMIKTKKIYKSDIEKCKDVKVDNINYRTYSFVVGLPATWSLYEMRVYPITLCDCIINKESKPSFAKSKHCKQLAWSLSKKFLASEFAYCLKQ